jgi:hypothetical protein
MPLSSHEGGHPAVQRMEVLQDPCCFNYVDYKQARAWGLLEGQKLAPGEVAAQSASSHAETKPELAEAQQRRFEIGLSKEARPSSPIRQSATPSVVRPKAEIEQPAQTSKPLPDPTGEGLAKRGSPSSALAEDVDKGLEKNEYVRYAPSGQRIELAWLYSSGGLLLSSSGNN